MKIAFLTPEFPNSRSAKSGGLGTSLVNLATALARNEQQIFVVLFRQKENAVFVENGIEIHLVSAPKYFLFSAYRERKHLEKYVNNLIAEKQIDLVEAADWTGTTAFMNLDAPLVVRFHGSDAYFCHLEGRKQRLKNFVLEKLGVHAADAFVAPTAFAGKLSKEIFNIDKPVQTIHYGLELSNFDNPQPEIFEKGLILYIGTIIRKKGVFELPEILESVLKNVPNAKLVLVGQDSADLQTGSKSTWKLLEKEFSSIAEHVEYVGKIPYDAVQEYIRRANVCIFPTFAETLGMVTIESMAMSKAVVNSNIGWSRELLVDGESGFLVHPHDHALFASRIVDLLQNEALCTDLGSAARRRVEQLFDINKTVRQNIDFYEKVLRK